MQRFDPDPDLDHTNLNSYLRLFCWGTIVVDNAMDFFIVMSVTDILVFFD